MVFYEPRSVGAVSLYLQTPQSFATWIETVFLLVDKAETFGFSKISTTVNMNRKREARPKSLTHLLKHISSLSSLCDTDGFFYGVGLRSGNTFSGMSASVFATPLPNRITVVVTVPRSGKKVIEQISLMPDCLFLYGEYLFEKYTQLSANFTYPGCMTAASFPTAVVESSVRFENFRKFYSTRVEEKSSQTRLVPELNSDAEVMAWYALALELEIATDKLFGTPVNPVVQNAFLAVERAGI
jgi:hypothetical protein